jgi:HEPN domain-containing protein
MSINIPQRWAEQGRYDLDTARAMLQSGRFIYVLFCCQQAVEKMLKGIIAKTTGEMPPRIHNLMQLVKRAGLEPDEEQSLLMRELSEYYIQSRYPEEIETVLPFAGPEISHDTLKRTEKIVEWLSSMI